MEEFLRFNPEFTNDARLIKKISRKIVFKDCPSLDSHLPLIRLPLFKKLLNSNFYKSDQLKSTYEEIVKKESSEIERMVFKVLCGKSVAFSDITLKFMFYKEFPQCRSLFTNDSGSVTFQIEDLLFRSVYFHEDTASSMQELVKGAPFLHRVFLILAMRSILAADFLAGAVFGIIREVGSSPAHETLRYLPMVLKALPRREFYALVTGEMLYSPLVEKMRVLSAVEDAIDHEKLAQCMLRECFATDVPVVKVYVVFLKVAEMLRLTYDFRVRLLYSWMRHFLQQGRLDLYGDLLEKLRKAKGKTREVEFYVALQEYLERKGGFERVQRLSKGVSDDKKFSDVTVEEIIEKYKPKGV